MAALLVALGACGGDPPMPRSTPEPSASGNAVTTPQRLRDGPARFTTTKRSIVDLESAKELPRPPEMLAHTSAEDTIYYADHVALHAYVPSRGSDRFRVELPDQSTLIQQVVVVEDRVWVIGQPGVAAFDRHDGRAVASFVPPDTTDVIRAPCCATVTGRGLYFLRGESDVFLLGDGEPVRLEPPASLAGKRPLAIEAQPTENGLCVWYAAGNAGTLRCFDPAGKTTWERPWQTSGHGLRDSQALWLLPSPPSLLLLTSQGQRDDAAYAEALDARNGAVVWSRPSAIGSLVAGDDGRLLGAVVANGTDARFVTPAEEELWSVRYERRGPVVTARVDEDLVFAALDWVTDATITEVVRVGKTGSVGWRAPITLGRPPVQEAGALSFIRYGNHLAVRVLEQGGHAEVFVLDLETGVLLLHAPKQRD